MSKSLNGNKSINPIRNELDLDLVVGELPRYVSVETFNSTYTTINIPFKTLGVTTYYLINEIHSFTFTIATVSNDFDTSIWCSFTGMNGETTTLTGTEAYSKMQARKIGKLKISIYHNLPGQPVMNTILINGSSTIGSDTADLKAILQTTQSLSTVPFIINASGTSSTALYKT